MIKTLDVRRNKVLENRMLAIVNTDYLADQLLTPVMVKDDTGEIAVAGTEHLREYETERALYDRSAHEMDMSYGVPLTYKVRYHDLKTYVPDRLVEQAENPFFPKRDASTKLLMSIKLKREVKLASVMTDITVLTQNITLSGGDQFNQKTTSNPDSVIQTACDTVFNSIGVEPNTCLIGRNVLNALKIHPFFLSMNSGLTVVSEKRIIENLKELYGFTNVYVTRQIKINTKQGQAVTRTTVWGDDIVVYYKGTGNMEPTLGFNFGLVGYQTRVRDTRDLEDEGSLIKVSNAYSDMIAMAEAGYLIKDAV